MLRSIVHGRFTPIPDKSSFPDDWQPTIAAPTIAGVTFLRGLPEALHAKAEPGWRKKRCSFEYSNPTAHQTRAWLGVNFDDGKWIIRPDPTGRFPIFYVTVGPRLFLSDSPHALLGFLPRIAAEPLAVSEYLLTGSVFPTVVSGSLIQGVSLLAQGQKILATNESFSFAADDDATGNTEPGDLVSRLRTAISLSTAKAVRGHQRVACLVSGGLDSCGLAAFALRLEAQEGHRTVLLHVGGGLGTEQEQQLRARFSATVGRPILAVQPNNGRSMMAVIEEANATAPYPSGSSFSAIFETIGRTAVQLDCTQLLSGDGGDEIFSTAPYLASEITLSSWRSIANALAWNRSRSHRSFSAELWNWFRTRLALSPRAAPIYGKLACSPEAAQQVAAKIEIAAGLIAHGDFVPKFEEFLHYWWKRRLAIVTSGMRLCDEWHERQWRMVPTYEPSFSYRPMCDELHRLAVACPLATEEIFRLAISQSLEETSTLLRRGVGKDLLRQTFADQLPPEICFYPKIGAIDDANLDCALVCETSAMSRLLYGTGLADAGVKVPSAEMLKPWRRALGTSGFYRLLILAAWLEGIHAHRVLKPSAIKTVEPAESRPMDSK